ncbi:flagellin [Clostridium sp. KNHs214]|uniref:flagellin N-terminal helical domain-containing protein n=1 Tax=Clostridium sp. KNHs214 TaxID=1540257 RepID=UPI0005546DEF|nr:flagellin [Clostridium sp. KNHs214]
MIINHNINAMTAYRNIMLHSNMCSKAMMRLSSGLRINSAADDAAGLAISERMRGQIRGLEQAARNTQDGISLIQTAEGALNETHSILQRMRELAVQAANDTNSPEDRKALQEELNQLTSEINRIGNTTEFNTRKLLNGGEGDLSNIILQTGANKGQECSVGIKDMRAEALKISGDTADGIVTSKDGTVTAKYTKIKNVTNDTSSNSQYALDISSHENASSAIKILDDAINNVSSQRASLGASENMLEHRISYLENTSENLTAAESRIRDADMAKEIMNLSRHSILQQVAQAMLVQANQQPNYIIELLKSL